MTSIEFGYLLEQYNSKLKMYAMKLTRDMEDAQDLLQETVLKALRYREKFSEGTNFSAWLHTIMKNTFINDYRRKKKRLIVRDETENQILLNNPVIASPISADNAILYNEIVKNVDALDEKYKVPFEMHCCGYKYHEIAEELNLPVGTVKSRIFTARNLLSSQLRAYVN
jgi:RNA polymerase sigma factor (sigma-70 family)